jgi:hypothetical protein
MNQQDNAKYPDRVEDSGKILIYEGHNQPNAKGRPDPKTIDQLEVNPSGTLTRNGRFKQTVGLYKTGKVQPELIRVYEKIKPNKWVYKGTFRLIDAWQEDREGRKVFKFKLEKDANEPPNDSDA